MFFLSNFFLQKRTLKLLIRGTNSSYINCIRGKCNKAVTGPPWNILFFGTDTFALVSLKALWAKLNTGTTISSLGVVSKHGTVIRKFAEAEGLPVYDWPVKTELIQSKYHIGIIVSFGNMIPQALIESFSLGCINVHASLLPRWRGAAPIIHSVINGDSETGVTIMKIVPHKFDVGDIVRQYRIAVHQNEMAKDVERRVSECGSSLLMECVRDLPRCLDRATPQPKHGVTLAPKVRAELARVDWQRMSAVQVYNLYRGLSHLYPPTCRWRDETVKLLEVSLDLTSPPSSRHASTDNHVSNQLLHATSHKSALDFLNSDSRFIKPSSTLNSSHHSGQVHYLKTNQKLKILCADGQYVFIGRVTIGNKSMSAKDFYNGFMSKVEKNKWKFERVPIK